MLRDLYDYLKTGQQRGNVLVDMADVDSFDYGFKELHWHIMRVQDILHGRDDTMVVSFYAPTQLTFGMARIYQQVADVDGPLQVHVSDTRDIALAVLNLPSLPPEPVFP